MANRCCRVPPVSSGELNKLITLKSRNLEAPTGNSIDYTELFTVLFQCFSKIETVRGKTTFDSVGQIRVITHKITIRFASNVGSETWVEFNNKNYEIISVENINEDNMWLVLNCFERGDKTIPVNQQ